MGKVVIVWNEHPTEVIGGFQAREVIRALREKYSHTVIPVKIPVGKTNYGIVTSRVSPREASRQLGKLQPSLTRAREEADKHDAIAFNFHTMPAMLMGKATSKPPEKWKIAHEHGRERRVAATHQYPGEIMFFHEGQPTHFVVELPAIGVQLKEKLREKNRFRVKDIAREATRGMPSGAQLNTDFNAGYYTEANLLNHELQQRYKDKAIAGKVAAEIDRKIKEREKTKRKIEIR